MVVVARVCHIVQRKTRRIGTAIILHLLCSCYNRGSSPEAPFNADDAIPLLISEAAMSTIFSSPHRRRRLDQAIANLQAEGYTLVERSEFHALLEKQTRRLFMTRRQQIRLEVDQFGMVQRKTV